MKAPGAGDPEKGLERADNQANSASAPVQNNGDANGAAAPQKKAKKGGDSAAEVNGQEVDFKKISIEEALNVLQVTREGLTQQEIEKRLQQYGPNKLPEKKRNPFFIFLGYLNNPLSWAMEIAAIIAICLLDFVDFGVILLLLFTNATISFVEESNADKSIKALTSSLAPKAKALRNGSLDQIDAATLVPGDVILVRIGDIVPADIKLIGDEHSGLLQVDQAALTGEALPVKKPPGDTALSGSTIKQGEMHALVFATGTNSFFGRTAALISGTENVANIQKIMTRIGAMCLVAIIVWIIIELPIQFRHYHHSCGAGVGKCPTLINMLVILIGGIPIAMPTVLSVTLALGAYQLAQEGAIVARMSAVEEMAGMDVLCSDKTGTLTLNKLSVDNPNIMALGGHSIDEMLLFAALSSQRNSEEAIDLVLEKACPLGEKMWDEYEQTKYVPFNPTDKFTTAQIRQKSNGESFRLMKGAPQVVLRHSTAAPDAQAAVQQKIEEYAHRGYRALGLSKGAVDGDKWEMLGLLPLFDPPRHDTKDTIEKCLKQGVRVKMITGDQLLIGKEVAKQLGMGNDFYTTEALLHDDPAEASDLVEKADGFAEVFPEHKFNIVEILQKRHHLVGMTGDGVNDAPALKKADVGIAVAGATEAARGAADIVLTEPGLSTINSAIIGARKIFQRMNTYAKYTIAMTFRIAFTFGILTVVYDWYFPALLIVLLAVFNDGAMIALAKDRVVPSATPSVWRLQNVFITGIVYGIYLSLSTWVLWYLAAKTHFFQRRIHLWDLNQRAGTLNAWCTDNINSRGLSPAASACVVPTYAQHFDCTATIGTAANPSVLQQCAAEQKWFRESMLRTLIYLQVSISGQGLVFVVRTQKWSLMSRAAVLTYAAFFIAQALATIVAVFGFNAYEFPAEHVKHCQFCLLSNGNHHPFVATGRAPKAFTESVHTDSIIGCLQYAVLAWIWSIIWYVFLDPIKWLLAYILNEDGFRDRHSHENNIQKARRARTQGKEGQPLEMASIHTGMATGADNWQNPLGRVSFVSMPTQADLERASVVRVNPDGSVGLVPATAGDSRRSSLSGPPSKTHVTVTHAGNPLQNPIPLMRQSLHQLS